MHVIDVCKDVQLAKIDNLRDAPMRPAFAENDPTVGKGRVCKSAVGRLSRPSQYDCFFRTQSSPPLVTHCTLPAISLGPETLNDRVFPSKGPIFSTPFFTMLLPLPKFALPDPTGMLAA
jgi:hypothetical protein